MHIARRVIVFLPLLFASALPSRGTLLAMLVVVVCLIVIRDARTATFARGPWLRSIGLGVLAGITIALVMGLAVNLLLVAMLGTPADVSAFSYVKGNVTGYVLFLLLALVQGGIVEETMFRGFVVGWGSRVFGERAGPMLVILSALAFGVSHLYPDWTGVD